MSDANAPPVEPGAASAYALDVSEARRLKQLEEENRQLKQATARRGLEAAASLWGHDDGTGHGG